MFLDQIFQRDAHLLFDDARVVDVTADTEKLCALITVSAKACKPARTTSTDRWRDSYGLNVRNCRGAPKETNIGGERRLEARLPLFALQALDEGGLLTADISTGSTMDVYIEGVTRTTCILPNETGLVSLIYRLLKV